MMRIVLAAAALLLAAAPAAAATGATCVVDQLNDQRKAEFFEAYRADVRPPEALQAALRAALQACVDTHGWTEAQQNAARRYSIAALLYGELLRVSPFTPEELARLGAAFDAVDDATKQRWMESGITEADNERVLAVLTAADVAVDQASGTYVGEYFAARHLSMVARAAFDAS